MEFDNSSSIETLINTSFVSSEVFPTSFVSSEVFPLLLPDLNNNNNTDLYSKNYPHNKQLGPLFLFNTILIVFFVILTGLGCIVVSGKKERERYRTQRTNNRHRHRRGLDLSNVFEMSTLINTLSALDAQCSEQREREQLGRNQLAAEAQEPPPDYDSHYRYRQASSLV